jgi:hypothetical protein
MRLETPTKSKPVKNIKKKKTDFPYLENNIFSSRITLRLHRNCNYERAGVCG